MAKKKRTAGYTESRQNYLGRIGSDRLGQCEVCQKSTWASRKIARRAAKNRHPEGGKSPYFCPIVNGWHYGTLHVDRDTYRGLDQHDDEGENDGLE